jgi:hypothetical protein
MSPGRPLLSLSIGLVTLMTLASCAGLLVEDLYRDNAMVAAGWFGNDLVTLFVATPLLLWSTALAPRVRRARVVWLGMLAYVLYNFAFYLLGAAFNPLFLVYAALVAGAGVVVVGGVASLARSPYAFVPAPSRALSAVAFYTGGVALLLGLFWVAVTIQALVQDTVPAMVTATDTHTNITAALDLTLVVVPGLIVAWWLRTGQRWGYVGAVIWNVKGAVYMAALTSATVAAWHAGAIADVSLAALWSSIGLGCMLASIVLLRDAVADD